MKTLIEKQLPYKYKVYEIIKEDILSGSRAAVEALYQARQPLYRQAADGRVMNHTTLEEAAGEALAEFSRLARPMAYRKDSNI